eukprot:m.41046 g.41046  ORF g.41046 m.41046 type:complete len:580 (+) comp5649_c0_seq1:190-1929(+)
MARITERENELTLSIDACDAAGIVRTLRQTDAQLFAGWRDYPGLFEPELLAKITRLSEQSLASIQESMRVGKVQRNYVFTGCGTSGRVAWLCARAYNAIMKSLCPDLPAMFHYRISGGDDALVLSKELPEDDPHLGMSNLQEITDIGPATTFIGITCGLSAPYVAGQVHYAMSAAHTTTVLLGFNPVELARNVPIENWDLRCYDVFTALQRKERESPATHVVLNPIVGPEPITGSSRMKGGSMTKLLLDAIFLSAIARLRNPDATPLTILGALERSAREAYSHIEGIATIVAAAGTALQQPSGHLYYVGRRAGLIGLIDASEMVDTYGCRLDEVRAFIAGGWATCANHEGDISARDPLLRLSLQDFQREITASLTSADTVVILSLDDFTAEDLTALGEIVASPATVHGLTVGHHGAGAQLDSLKLAHHHVCVLTQTGVADLGEPVYADFALKLLANAITTGANIIKGSVYGHTMINLTVSNNKLFQRSIEIVAKLTGCSLEDADVSLRRAIFETDDVTASRSILLSHVIEIATPKALVVPTACLLAAGYRHSDATAALRSGVRLRDLIGQAVQARAAMQ